MKFVVLRFLCNLQSVAGWVVIVFGVAFVIVSSNVPDESGGLGTLMVLAIAAGLCFFGLQMIALAQVFLCLLQIEINTRKVA